MPTDLNVVQSLLFYKHIFIDSDNIYLKLHKLPRRYVPGGCGVCVRTRACMRAACVCERKREEGMGEEREKESKVCCLHKATSAG